MKKPISERVRNLEFNVTSCGIGIEENRKRIDKLEERRTASENFWFTILFLLFVISMSGIFLYRANLIEEKSKQLEEIKQMLLKSGIIEYEMKPTDKIRLKTK